MDMIEHRVRERAYYIWEGEGRVHGRAEAHWLQAEAECVAVSAETAAAAEVNAVGVAKVSTKVAAKPAAPKAKAPAKTAAKLTAKTADKAPAKPKRTPRVEAGVSLH